MGRVATRAGPAESPAPLHPLLRRPAAAKGGAFRALRVVILRAARRCGLLPAHGQRGATLAVDATGLAARDVGLDYTTRRFRAGGKPWECLARRFPKLTAVVETGSQLGLGAIATRGPSHDAPPFGPAMRQAAAVTTAAGVPLGAALADAAYDAERRHVLCREQLQIPRVLIPVNRRGRNCARARYRHALDRRFPRRAYRQRWHAASAFSRHKRRLGDALSARRPLAQRHEVLLRVLTHDLLILWRVGRGSFQQSSTECQVDECCAPSPGAASTARARSEGGAVAAGRPAAGRRALQLPRGGSVELRRP